MGLDSTTPGTTFYHLRPQDFLGSEPFEMEEWKYPDPINRRRWTPFIGHSFVVARGDPNGHGQYLRFIKATLGFDTFATLQWFDSFGWSYLSEAEKTYLYNGHQSANQERHLRHVTMDDFGDAFMDGLGRDIQSLGRISIF